VRVISEEEAENDRPDAYLLTAWNYEREILAKNADFLGRGGRFVLPLPYPRVA
jgi:novobiocin biosynthesis protein NovU/D-mycarose 3-C-methyltransferase